jgi:hypothetical protein
MEKYNTHGQEDRVFWSYDTAHVGWKGWRRKKRKKKKRIWEKVPVAEPPFFHNVHTRSSLVWRSSRCGGMQKKKKKK